MYHQKPMYTEVEAGLDENSQMLQVKTNMNVNGTSPELMEADNRRKFRKYTSGESVIIGVVLGLFLTYLFGGVHDSSDDRDHQKSLEVVNRNYRAELDDKYFDDVHDTMLSAIGLDGFSMEGEVYMQNPALVYMNHSQAYLQVTTSMSTSHYFELNLGFDAQINQAYCGAATAATVLNSLLDIHNELPVDVVYSPYRYATQTDIFESECVKENVLILKDEQGHDGIWTAPMGLSLEQVFGLLKCHLENLNLSWSLDLNHANPNTLTMDEMREIFIQSLSSEHSRILINYYRKGLGQIGGGHFSPIGAYDKGTDSFLIMDVAKYKYAPVWASSDSIYRALTTQDHCGVWDWPNGQTRLPEHLKEPKTVEEWRQAFKILKCQTSYRGFIIIKEQVQ